MSDFPFTTQTKQEEPILFKLPRTSMRPTTGLRQLANQFTMILLREPTMEDDGVIVGAGLRSKIAGANSDGEAEALCAAAVIQAESQITAAQAISATKYLPSERLRSATLISAEAEVTDFRRITVRMVVSLTSADNNSLSVPFSIERVL